MSLTYHVKTALLCLLLLWLSVAQGQEHRLSSMAGLHSIKIIENKGQITQQDGSIRHDIDYKVAASSLNVFISKDGLHYQFCKPAKETSATPFKLENSSEPSPLFPDRYDAYRLDMHLVGANPSAKATSENIQPYYERYLNSANEDLQMVHSYQKVTYKNIYKNIDWCIYVKGNSLEYDFIINPGGNPQDIAIKYSGASAISETSEGVVINTPLGCVKENNLYAYCVSNHKTIQSSFMLADSILKFRIAAGKNTNNMPYVIDPTLEWGTYYGGSNLNTGYAVACDNSENAYITGTSSSTDNIATTGAYQATLAGASDAFVAKFNASGTLLWSTYYGGHGSEVGHSICCDHSGNIYVAGSTNSDDQIATSGAFKSVYTGPNDDAFVVKLTGSGSRVWGTYFGGDSSESANGIMCDALDNVYLAGRTNSHTNIASAGAFQTVYGGGGGDIYIAKFSPSGAVQWSTYLGGSGDENNACIATDNNLNLFIGGKTQSSSAIATAGASQVALNGPQDAFLAKFTSSGSRLWSTYYGGEGLDICQGVCLDNGGGIYMAGATASMSGIATAGAHQPSYGGGPYDAFLSKFDTAGAPLWGTYYGGSGDDNAVGLSFLSSGNIAVTGVTLSGSGISSSGAWQAALSGTKNAFLADFSPAGTLLWGSYYGGDRTSAMGIASSASGNLYITGQAQADSGISTTGAHQVSLLGISSGYLAKFGSFTTGVGDEPTVVKNLVVYPIPNNGVFSVSYELSSPLQEVVFSVVGLDGRVHYFQHHVPNNSSGKETIALPFLPAGTYVFRISTRLGEVARKFSVIK